MPLSAADTADTADTAVNVLLVDDHPPNLLALEAILADLGQNLVRAHSGEEALRLLADNDFAVVLLDVRMPGLSGFEAARLIRGRERSRSTPIIFLTAAETPDFPVEEAYLLGAVDYLVKPLVPVILRAKVAGFVELFQKTERLRRMERADFELRLAESARQGEERLRFVVENLTDYAVFLLDPSGKVQSWNAGAERLLGYREVEAVGMHFGHFFSEEDRQADQPGKELREAGATGRVSDDSWLVRKDGSRLWASGVSAAVRDSCGSLQGFVKIFRDLTDRKQLEDELQRRAERLVEDARRKDEFLAMLAHELRNPLSPLLTGLPILHDSSADEAVRKQTLERMERQVRHLSRLVEDLLDASRVTHGKMGLRPERLDLARVARAVAEDHRALLEQAGVALAVEAPDTPVWVRGDATRLAQMANNLLDNAAKFSDRGGRVAVRVATDLAFDQAVLVISDTSVGISADVLPRLFQPFMQADQGLERRRGGLGLGLSVVKGLAELHGGTVEARSDGPGCGATFTVRLPLVEEPPALADSHGAPPAAGRSRRILVVEDNRDTADSLCALLGLLGHEVRAAYSGPAGVQAAADWPPDVVLCDVGLPGFDGFEVARRLRRQSGLEKVLLVALTGYGSDDDRRQSRLAGFDYHLTKPADPDDILRVLSGRVA